MSLGSWRELMTPKHGENLLKKQTNTKIFYCNLESKNLSMHLHHHRANSRQSSSEEQILTSELLHSNYYYIAISDKSNVQLTALAQKLII